jgi:hypothetical protein
LPPTRIDFDTTMPDDGYFGRAAADVDDHVAAGIGHRNLRADRGGQRLGDKVGAACAAGQRGIPHGAAFHAGDAGRHADHHVRLGQRETPDRLVDEVAQHLLGDNVVGDDPIAHRAHDLDRLAWLAAQHVARFQPDRFDLAVARRDRHH